MATLFLDRDGVINQRIPGHYVRTPDEFRFLEGAAEAVARLSPLFGHIFVVTNQAGIGKGLMTEMQLHTVHLKMLGEISRHGGRIDRIYHCPHRPEARCPCRKPATGMAWSALADFPDMDLEDAWMVGDSASDMAFAAKLGIRSALIRGKMEEAEVLGAMPIDFRFDSLMAFALWVG